MEACEQPHEGMAPCSGQVRQQEDKCSELRRRADYFQSEMEESKLQANLAPHAWPARSPVTRPRSTSPAHLCEPLAHQPKLRCCSAHDEPFGLHCGCPDASGGPTAAFAAAQSSNKEMELIEERERSSHLYDQLLDARNELTSKTSELHCLSMQSRRAHVRWLPPLRTLRCLHCIPIRPTVLPVRWLSCLPCCASEASWSRLLVRRWPPRVPAPRQRTGCFIALPVV